jgi:predicted ester cyclase
MDAATWGCGTSPGPDPCWDLIAVDDKVVERFTARGTREGELMRIAPTGQTMTLPGIDIFRIQDGKIIERWGIVDQLGLMRQLGAVPAAA